MTNPVLELSDLSKDYRGLRPLRLERLVLNRGEHVAIVGFDRPMAEVLVNLVTGATLPDRGRIVVDGRMTASITDGGEWLALADRFGLVSERAVLLDAFSVLQNLAIPFSLEVDPIDAAVRRNAVDLARELGLPEETWDRRLAEVAAIPRLLVRVGRALALRPEIVLSEHPTSELARTDVALAARQLRGIFQRRRVAALTLTADESFAQSCADRALRLDAASGRLTDMTRTGWFGARRR